MDSIVMNAEQDHGFSEDSNWSVQSADYWSRAFTQTDDRIVIDVDIGHYLKRLWPFGDNPPAKRRKIESTTSKDLKNQTQESTLTYTPAIVTPEVKKEYQVPEKSTNSGKTEGLNSSSTWYEDVSSTEMDQDVSMDVDYA